jgi:hypothetical protein
LKVFAYKCITTSNILIENVKYDAICVLLVAIRFGLVYYLIFS